MKIACFLSVIVVVNAGLFENCDDLFEDFKVRYKMKYSSDNEETMRHGVFCSNMKLADLYNSENGSPVFGASKFSDKTRQEFGIVLGRKDQGVFKQGDDLRSVTVRSPYAGPEKYGNRKGKAKQFTGVLPDVVDWTAVEGVVTPVKNQGQCGSCWAFSAAETVESQWAMNGNSAWEFSPQQIASCTTGVRGCGGGDTVAAYEYIMGLPAGQGLGSAAFAPYVQSMFTGCSIRLCTEACSSINTTSLETYEALTGPFATVTGYQYATPPCTDTCSAQNLTLLQQNLATYGPASVCVDASRWNLYTGGVMTLAGCGGYAYSDLDHCVQLTGYNSAGNYWLVRNSWATNWGEDGYIYLELDANTCGLANEATFVSIGNDQ